MTLAQFRERQAWLAGREARLAEQEAEALAIRQSATDLPCEAHRIRGCCLRISFGSI